jgi:hypothetical protein
MFLRSGCVTLTDKRTNIHCIESYRQLCCGVAVLLGCGAIKPRIPCQARCCPRNLFQPVDVGFMTLKAAARSNIFLPLALLEAFRRPCPRRYIQHHYILGPLTEVCGGEGSLFNSRPQLDSVICLSVHIAPPPRKWLHSVMSEESPLAFLVAM